MQAEAVSNLPASDAAPRARTVSPVRIDVSGSPGGAARAPADGAGTGSRRRRRPAGEHVDLRFGVPVPPLCESGGTMGGMALPQVAPVETPEIEEVPADDRPWVTIVWDDPVNLMSYVTWVFQKLFGYSQDKAEQLMMDVHTKGKAVVSTGAREKMEMDASQLHGYGLWATVDRA
jgi:ATP-dependent Clp protease adaptor protein ClpS